MKRSTLKDILIAVLVTALMVYASQVKAFARLPSINIIANTAYGVDAAGNGAELCVLTINGETETYVASCSDLGQDVYKQLQRDYPLAAVTLTINGRSINQI